MKKVLYSDFVEIHQIMKQDLLLFRNSSWIITGASGMIGYYFISFLVWLNQLPGIDNSIKATCVHRSDISNKPWLVELSVCKELTFIKQDLAIDYSINFSGFDYILHLASNASPLQYQKEPITTLKSNAMFLFRLFDNLINNSSSVKKILYFSSGEVYGDVNLEHIPTKEEYVGKIDHLNDRACYVESKRFSETICLNYRNTFELPVVIIRPVHVFGPGITNKDKRVWADFIFKAMDHQNLEILGDGTSERGFCYLRDAIIELLSIMLFGKHFVYNIGNDTSTSIKLLADCIVDVTGTKSEVLIKNRTPVHLQNSPKRSCPSIERVKSLLQFNNTPLPIAIERTVDWCKEYFRG